LRFRHVDEHSDKSLALYGKIPLSFGVLIRRNLISVFK